MATLMNREQAMEVLKPFDGLEVRSFSPNDSFGFKKQNSGGYVYQFGSKSDSVPVTPEAWNYVYKASGLPGHVINKLPDDIHTQFVVPIVDYKFRSAEQDMQALINENQIIGFARGDVTVHNPKELMLAMEKAIGKKSIRGYDVFGSIDRQYISLLGNNERRVGKTYDRKGNFVGAVMGHGVSVYVSPFGLTVPGGNQPLEINGWNQTLVCTNGAISTQNIAHYTKKDFDQEFTEWFPGKVLEVYNAAELEYDRIKAMQDVRLPAHTAERMDSMLEQFSVPPVIRGAVAARLIDFPVSNLLGLWNHVTYVASNYATVREDPSLVRRLQLAAGTMVRNQHICDTCHQVVKPQRRVNREVADAFGGDREN